MLKILKFLCKLTLFSLSTKQFISISILNIRKQIHLKLYEIFNIQNE